MRRTSRRCGKQAVGCDGAPLELPKIGTREKPVPPSENSLLTPDKSGSGDDIEESNDLHVVDVDAEADVANNLDSVLENKEVILAFPLPKPMTPQKRRCKEEDNLFSLVIMPASKKVVGPLCKSHPATVTKETILFVEISQPTYILQ